MSMSTRAPVLPPSRSFIFVASQLSIALVLVAGCNTPLDGAIDAGRGDAPRADGACPGCPGEDAGPGRDVGPLADAPGRPDAPVVATCEGAPTPGPVSFTALPEGEDMIAPGRGAERWHDQFYVDVPREGDSTTPLDVYQRFTWSQLEDGSGGYDWRRFDEVLDDAIANRQKMSFGIMTACPGCPEDYNGMVRLGGALAAYPADVHAAMQAERDADWVSDGYWVPNWNSPTYLDRYEALLRAIDAHLASGSHMGVRYRDAIGYIDVRGYGSWGEWHVYGIADTVNDQPPGRVASAARLTRLIDMHVSAFPTHPLVLMICTFDGGRFPNMGVPVEVGAHALSVSNEFGPLGWRRDNWGALDDYIRWLLDWNTGEASGVVLADEIMSRWQTSPIVGEPPGFRPGPGSCDYDDYESQVRLFHAVMLGNGNYGGAESSSCARDAIRRAFRASGYRIVLEGGEAPEVLNQGGPLSVTLRWQNHGVAPTYERWDVSYELLDSGGAVVWSAPSSFEPRLFLPSDTATSVTDDLVLPESVPEGSYDLVVVSRDPSGFRAPLPLAIEGRRSDGSYLLRRVTVQGCPTP